MYEGLQKRTSELLTTIPNKHSSMKKKGQLKSGYDGRGILQNAVSLVFACGKLLFVGQGDTQYNDVLNKQIKANREQI